MAIRSARHVRPLLAIAALGASLAVAPTLASAAPAGPRTEPTTQPAKPTIASVQKQLGEYAVTSSQLVEDYNQARINVAAAQRAATTAATAARTAAANYVRASQSFTRTVQAQYESGGMSTGGALLTSDSGSNYLDRLDTIRLLSNHNADVVGNVAKTRGIAASKSTAAATALAKAKAQKAKVSAQRTKVNNQISKYQTLLATLTAAQQAAYHRATNPTVSQKTLKTIAVHASTAGAQRAVQFALDQVGKSYVFGAAGPSSYDCSGLTMRAWEHGGVNLPHSAADQYNYGKHVSRSELQPGDLIFFYQPIGHVTIYIGNGYMVSAPTEGEPVQVVALDHFNSDYVGATHLG